MYIYLHFEKGIHIHIHVMQKIEEINRECVKKMDKA